MREFLMLAKPYQNDKVIGWFLSEKLDGMRAFWDGGVTRGKYGPPWNNQNIKATGLWSRYAKVIHAPDWFLDLLLPL